MPKIILASASPRRRQLLHQVGAKFEVVTSNVEENIEQQMPASDLVQALAYAKARDVAYHIHDNACIVIGADTVVVYNDQILGKPQHKEHAYEMLRMLSGSTHEVFTGFAIIDKHTDKSVKQYEKTRVTFRQLNDREINAYIKTGEPMDKAGAYGIQEIGSLLIESIQGDYFNVVGLPIMRVACLLKSEFGIDNIIDTLKE